MVCLPRLICVALAVSHAAAQQWSLKVDSSSGAITSVSDGNSELVSSITAANTLQLISEGVNASASSPTSPCSVSSDSAECNYLVQMGGGCSIAVQYYLSLSVLPGTPTPYTVLNQTAAISPSPSGTCGGLPWLVLYVPRAATLLPLSGNASSTAATRMLRTQMQYNSTWDAAVTAGNEPNGFCHLSAGDAEYLTPYKTTPACGDYVVSVPVIEEYLSVNGSVVNTGAPRLTIITDVYLTGTLLFGDFPWSNGFATMWNCTEVPCFADRASEVRSLYTVIARDVAPEDESDDANWEARMAKFYATALADIPPPPDWIHTIRMVDYDYFSPLPPSPYGFEADVDAVAAALPDPADRARVLWNVHGAYGLVGQYAMSSWTDPQLLPSWQVFPSGGNFTNPTTRLPMGPINVTVDTIRGRLQHARSAGMRTTLYIADGLNTCTGVPFYAEQEPHTLARQGYEWQGPDTIGDMKELNPLSPAVQAFFTGYLGQLLDNYGDVIDGFVWDETFMLSPGQGGSDAYPGLAVRAWMELLKSMRAQIRAHPLCAGRCVLLVADCARAPPMALMVDGTYEDNGLQTYAAPYGVLQNYRGVLWQCAWCATTIGYAGGNGTEQVLVQYNIPSAIANGWGDFQGFNVYPQVERDWFLGLMLHHNDSVGPRFAPNAGRPT